MTHRPCPPRFPAGPLLLFGLFMLFPRAGKALLLVFAAMILLGLWCSTFPPR